MQDRFKKIELFVEKVREHTQNSSASTTSTACTNSTYSSASTAALDEIEQLNNQNPALADAMMTIHDKGMKELGEAEFIEAIISKSHEIDPLSTLPDMQFVASQNKPSHR
ncbi:hypothetical protein M9194_04900 [Vibrio sp. S4M6]|uniref:hypothetical protein n=1 Tax=Vibrio sinus TaxID=2946865 RepID=UPI00202ABA9C|nr:hypothetical protein [Vibrio sinus]MCL9780776.1 hypothetical protein [Vibrio sinus]